MMRRSLCFLSVLPAELEDKINRIVHAQERLLMLNQDHVDRIFHAAALEASANRLTLAKLAVQDTRMGVVEDKVVMNHYASEIVYNKFKNMRTVGIVGEDRETGISRMASPVGPVLATVPAMSPSSSLLYKSLISLKTRNAVLFAPDARAAKFTAAATRLLHDAAVKAGAPRDCLLSLEDITPDTLITAANHPSIKFVLASMCQNKQLASVTGKPVFGLGMSNCPAVIDETANIPNAVSSILMSKVFDNGMICASEQSIIVVESRLEELRAELKRCGACVLEAAASIDKLSLAMYNTTNETPSSDAFADGCSLTGLNPAVIGQTAVKVAAIADIKLDPVDASLIVADLSSRKFDPTHPLSGEKRCPVLSLYTAKNYRQAMERAKQLVSAHAASHSAVLYTNQEHRDRIHEFELMMPTGRILVDVPATFGGAAADVVSSRLEPTMSLGRGDFAGNSFTGNVGPRMLLNMTTMAEKRETMKWLKLPSAIYYKSNILGEALKDLRLRGSRRALIVCDHVMSVQGATQRVVDELKRLNIECEVFDNVLTTTSTECIAAGVAAAKTFKPDTIIAIGGGSPIDAAKIIRLMYEHPDIDIAHMFTRFMDIRKRVYSMPLLGTKVHTVVAIPTTSGTGAEVTPFAVISDPKTGRKYPIASYRLTPDVAICDGSLAITMPAMLAAHTGMDALTHAVESYVSVMSSPLTKPHSVEALRILMHNLEKSVKKACPEAREQVHMASTMAGMAYANGFLGVCHSMAHALGSFFPISHGLANAYCLAPVIRFNASASPMRRASISQTIPQIHAAEDYCKLAAELDLVKPGQTDADKVDELIIAIQRLKRNIGIAASIKSGEQQITEEEYRSKIPLMAEAAFDDQCSGSNPRSPMIKELECLFEAAFEGDSKTCGLWEHKSTQALHSIFM